MIRLDGTKPILHKEDFVDVRPKISGSYLTVKLAHLNSKVISIISTYKFVWTVFLYDRLSTFLNVQPFHFSSFLSYSGLACLQFMCWVVLLQHLFVFWQVILCLSPYLVVVDDEVRVFLKGLRND